jgi:hypothetical protein
MHRYAKIYPHNVAYFFRAHLTPLTFALQNGSIRYEKAYMFIFYFQDDYSESVRIPSKYQDDFSLGRPSTGRERPRSGQSSVRSAYTESKPPTPPPFNPVLQSTVPMPASQMALVAAASGES